MAVEFVSVNIRSGVDDQDEILKKCSFPFFQDTLEAGVWDLHDGGKDDMYVYGADGLLSAYLPASGALSTNLRTSEGFQNLKDAILQAVGN